MFEFIRTHQRLMQLLLLIIIFPSFAFFGIESYTRSRASDSTVATVAGIAISQQEFDSAQRDRLDRLRQTYGPQFDAKIFNSPEAKQVLLDELVSRKALIVEADREHLAIPDAVLQQVIASNSAFAKPDGTFDNDLYKKLLDSQRMNNQTYEKSVRQDLVLQQLINAVQETAFVPKTVAERFSLINEQERDVQALEFKANDFASKVKITDALLKQYYDQNPRLFELPEVAKAEYIVLNAESLSSQITVTDDDIKKQYEANPKSYTSKEQRRASHILIDVKKDATAADKKAAKEKAEALLAELRKKPELFAKLAKENSKDPGSAERGGDLDFFERGSMVKQFDETAFKLKKGDISDVVETDFGFHIIQLTDIKPESLKPLSEVKEQIAAEIKGRKLPKLFSDTADTFRDAVDEQTGSLQSVADKYKLKIEIADNLTRNPNPSQPPNLLTSNPKFLTALFSDGSLKKKNNTGAIETAPNTLIVGRIVDYKPASKRPFDDVKAQIVTQVTAIEAEKLAQKAGETKLQALKLADSAEGFSATKTVSRQKPDGIAGSAFGEIFKADVQKLPVFIGVSNPTIGYTVYRIGKVIQGTPDPVKRSNDQRQISNTVAQAETLAYIEALKQKAKVTINKAALTTPSVSTTE